MGAVFVTMILDRGVIEWLASEGVAVPADAGASRWPSPLELRAVLDGLADFDVAYQSNGQGGWDASITDARPGREDFQASIWVKDIRDETEPTPFSFHKPRAETAILVLEALSRTCGPFALVDDSAMRPVVVTPGCDPAELAARMSGAEKRDRRI